MIIHLQKPEFLDAKSCITYNIDIYSHIALTKREGVLIMKNKSILALVLTLVMVFTMTMPTMAATKASTKTVTFNSYDSKYVNAPVTIKVTNVTAQKTKDFSFYMSDDKVTISGKNSKVIYAKAPVSITLQPNKGAKQAGFFNFYMCFDSNKVAPNTVVRTDKYYAYDMNEWEFDFSKKYDKVPGDAWGYAEGSNMKITKAGTYVLYVKSVNDVDDETTGLTPVFIVVK
jgi:hypothetical protein